MKNRRLRVFRKGTPLQAGGGGGGPAFLRWSDPATWGGSLPIAGEPVDIGVNSRILLDIDTPALGALTINGKLKVDPDLNTSLTASQISLTGTLQAGEWTQFGGEDVAVTPHTKQFVITLTGGYVLPTTNPNGGTIANGNQRGLMVEDGGKLLLEGNPPVVCWTKLNAHSAGNATTFTTKDAALGWKAGDQVVVGPTDFFSMPSGAVDLRTLAADSSGTNFTVTAAVPASRWGRLQYATDAGMSLTPGTYTPPGVTKDIPSGFTGSEHPTILDERAPIANLTRNIVIQGANDAAWTNNGWGGHVMVMGVNSRAKLNGVEFRRMGQKGVLARYCFHWHLGSYANATGSTGVVPTQLGDKTHDYIKNCSMHTLANRGLVVHGTHGTTAENNIVYGSQGHAYFMEDAVEQRNVWKDNLALLAQVSSVPMQQHELAGAAGEAGPSGYWITNVNNTITGNHAYACHAGFWLATPDVPLGLCSKVVITPRFQPVLAFNDNVGGCNIQNGAFNDNAPVGLAGVVTASTRHQSKVGGAANGAIVFDVLMRNSFFKNRGGYKNRVSNTAYREWVNADNKHINFYGAAGEDTNIQRCLIIGTSLNDNGAEPAHSNDAKFSRAGIATYNGSVDSPNNAFFNLPYVTDKVSGMYETEYYFQGAQLLHTRNGGAKRVNAYHGFREIAAAAESDASQLDSTLSGAAYDEFGYTTGTPGWNVYDMPFFTAGAVTQALPQSGVVMADGTYFGIQYGSVYLDSRRNGTLSNSDEVITRRVQADGVTEIDRWRVAGRNNGPYIDGSTAEQFRHAGLRKGGYYTVDFPTLLPAVKLGLSITNCYRPGDYAMVGLPFDCSKNITGYWTSKENNWSDPFGQHVTGYWSNRPTECKFFRTEVFSVAAVEAGDGTLYYKDVANNKVWVKCVGGMNFVKRAGSTDRDDNDILVYKSHGLWIYAI